MRVLHINVTYEFGSTGRIVSYNHKALLNAGHQSEILFGRHFNPHKNDKITRVGSNFSHMLHGIKTRLLDRHGFGSKSSTLKTLKKIDLSRFDIIHLHNIHGYYIHIGVLFKMLKKVNKNVVWTLHDSWSYTGHCFGYQSVNCIKWKTECHDCPLKSTYPKSFFLDQSKKNYRDKKGIFNQISKLNLVTPSTYLYNELSNSFLSNFQKYIIPNGIDLSAFKLKKDIPSGKFKILGVANIWETRKGLQDIINLSNFLDSNKFEFRIVGTLPKGMILPQDFIYVPHISSVSFMNETYQKANVLLHLSTEDNLPTIITESIASGTPVIAYDIGGVKDIVHSNSGFVLKPNDIEGVIDKIHLLKNNLSSYSPDLVASKIDVFDKKNMIDKYMKLYDEVQL